MTKKNFAVAVHKILDLTNAGTSRSLLLIGLFAINGFSQVRVPEGTKLRVRLEQSITSATAEEGQIVELSVVEPVKINGTTAFAEGARVTGTITEAQEKRRLGRAGKLDFSIDRVKTADDQWVNLRYTLNKKSGESHAVRTGVITAGAALVFWPAAPVFLLMKGKDITINKGVTFDVFTDTDHMVGGVPPTIVASGPRVTNVSTTTSYPQSPLTGPIPAVSSATMSITSSIASADIELDGTFVGNTPTTIQLASGQHHVVIKSGAKVWERTIQVNGGSTISLNANFQ